MSREEILPPPSSHSGDRQPHTGPGSATMTRSDFNRATVGAFEPDTHPAALAAHAARTVPSLPDLARAAADAVTQLCATLRDCEREVSDRGGKRVARGQRIIVVQETHYALSRLLCALPGDLRSSPSVEVTEMIEGCTYGYCAPAWSLRLMQMAAAVPDEERKTEPSPEPVEVDHG